MTKLPISVCIGLTALIGFVGALSALFLSIPVPWLLGPLLVCTLISACGIPLCPPTGVEKILRVVIGVALGPSVANSLSDSATRLPIAIAAAAIFIGLLMMLGSAWFRRAAGLSRPVAFLAALPGGLSFMLALASNVSGSRPMIALIHTVRVSSLVVFVSLLSSVIGTETPVSSVGAALEFNWSMSLLVWAALFVTSYLIANQLSIPGGHVIFPMVIAAAVTTLTDLNTETPVLFKTLAMLAFGIIMGCEVGSGPKHLYARLGLAALSYTAGAFVVAATIALTLELIVDETFLVLFLALAPGGIAEVSLIALALGLDAGFVALVHACRFLLIMLAGPIGLRMYTGAKGDVDS